MIQVSDFSFQYSKHTPLILDEINLTIETGEWVVITGKSGCGKSTFARALAGFLFHPLTGIANGSIESNGISIKTIPLHEWSREVYLVQQNPKNQFCTLSVQDEIAFGLENRLEPPEVISERLAFALDAVQGAHLETRNILELSGGEQQKIAIATAIALSPKLLIMDEPSSNLDPDSTRRLYQVLLHLQDTLDLSVVIFEHNTALLDSLTTNHFMLEAGKLFKTALPAWDIFFQKQKESEFVSNNVIGKEIIQLENYQVFREEKPILDVQDFSLHEKQIISLSGPNGSGKTSFLMSLMGFLPSRADIKSIFDSEISESPSNKIRQQIGFAFQNPDDQLFCESVQEEIEYGPNNFYSKANLFQRWMQHLIEVFGFGETREKHPYILSYGQKGRLNLTAILSYKPKLLLLDEIFIGQDPANIEFLLDFIYQYMQGESAGVIIVNHHPEVMTQFATAHYEIKDGKMRAANE